MGAQNWVILAFVLAAMYGGLVLAGCWVFRLGFRQVVEPQANSPRRTR
jgi:hypothetical protein